MENINENKINKILNSYNINKKKATDEALELSGVLTSLEKAIDSSEISKKGECKICQGPLLDIYNFTNLYAQVYNKIGPRNEKINKVLTESLNDEINTNKMSKYFSKVMKIPQNDYKKEIHAVKAISKYIKENFPSRSFENCSEKNVVYVSELFNHILNIKKVKHQNI